MAEMQGLPGRQWIPSNGTVGYSFLEHTCGNCARDKAMREGCDVDECDDNERCEIIAASFRGKAVEWRVLETGEVFCMAFVPAGEPIPEPRCTATIDMFEAHNAELLGAPPTGGASHTNAVLGAVVSPAPTFDQGDKT